jgi:hypothetical protein
LLRSSKIVPVLIPLLVFAFGLLNCGRDLFGPGFSHYPGDLADTRFNNVILEHDYQWLIGNQESLWDAPFCYPSKNMLAGSDNHLGTLLLYVPFRFAGLNETRSFQFWVLCLLTLNFAVFYWVARKLALNPLASAAGAFLFTFSMPVLGSVYHIQTLCKFSFPLVIYFFYLVLFKAQGKNLVYFSLALVHVFYCSLYFGVFTLLLLLVFLIAALVMRQHQLKALFNRENRLWLIGSVIVLAGLLIPLLLPYREQEELAMLYKSKDLMPAVPHFFSYFTPSSGTAFYPFLFSAMTTYTEAVWMHTFFTGFFSIALVVMAVYLLWKSKSATSPNQKFFVLCGFTLLGGLALTTTVGDISLYRILIKIDVFNHLKVPGRIVLLELFFAAMLVAYALENIHLKGGKLKLLALGLAVLVCAEHWIKPGTLKHEAIQIAQDHHLYVNNGIDGLHRNEKAFVVLKGEKEGYEHVVQIDAMMASLQKGLPTVNGYTTVVDPWFYTVYTDGLPGVATWLEHCRADSLLRGEKILFIP